MTAILMETTTAVDLGDVMAAMMAASMVEHSDGLMAVSTDALMADLMDRLLAESSGAMMAD